jgi:putative ABC transport system permease protein
MTSLIQDVKHSVRVLLSAPSFTATAIVAIALGLGANTAIFSVVNSVLLRPLPFPEPDRIVLLMNSTQRGTFPGSSVPKYNVWRTQTATLQDVAAYDGGGPGINIGGGERPEQAKGIHVSHEFFRLFGVPVTLGRPFTAEEDRPGGGRVVLISDGLWSRRFGKDPAITGRTIILGGEPYTIIGVVGSGFDFNPTPDLLLPFQADPNSTQQAHFFQTAARLKDGVSLEQARESLKSTAAEFRSRFPQQLGPNDGFSVGFLQENMVRNVRPALLVLLGAVGFVLLMACVNVANLLLARASVRARELAIRAAIGAGRWRIVRQLLTESVLLAVAGGIVGLALGAAGVRGLLALNPGGLPRIGEDGSGISLDWRVFAFAAVAAILTGVIFGVFPALQASRVDLSSTFKDSTGRGTSRSQNRIRSALVIVELTLAIVLLAGAGLLIRTFAALQSVDPGFEARGVLTLETSLTGSKFETAAGIEGLTRRAIEKIEALPGIESAAASSYLPLEGGLGLPFAIAGRPRTEGPADGGAGWAYVTPRFFEVFKVKLVRGRAFTERDGAGNPGVVIVNEAFARRFFEKQNPLEQRLTIGPGMGPAFAEGAREVVGVVADARDGGLNSDPQPQMFVPMAQVRDSVLALNNRFMPLTWVVRTRQNPLMSAQPLQQIFNEVADLPAARARAMDQVVSQSIARNRFNTLLLAIFAGLAIFLAAVGLYGLMSYMVEQRTVEFGIRMALGADQPSLRNLVLKQAMQLALAGTALGCVAAYFMTSFLSTMLYGVTARDPLAFIGAALLLTAVMLFASYWPARRAFGIDPLVAIRQQ